jgi:hypothetical protein
MLLDPGAKFIFEKSLPGNSFDQKDYQISD